MTPLTAEDAPAQGIYVYCIVRAGHPLPPGRGGLGRPPAPLRALRAGAVAAVVSAAPASLLARRRDLTAHQEVLLSLAAAGPVAPMRFGVLAHDDAALRDELATSEAEHLRALQRLDGRLEMNLKVFPAEHALADLLRQDPRLLRLRDAARAAPGYEASVRLGEAIATGLRRRAARAASRVLRGLAPLAEATADGPEVPNCVRNVSFLIRRSELEAFRAEAAAHVSRLGDQADMRLSGPLPCFSFASPTRPVTAGRA
jgi:hypothetical protein